MLYKSLVLLIEKGVTDGLREKIDLLFAFARLTDEEYTTLDDMLLARGTQEAAP
ncbi:hypothetical protein LJC74_06920 [Eubacteriales bacterium OttesenSCG-928-A19]|nr:hypothetical protein [Eubacteriales bacterium OttesenSCG-928-A19]